MAQRTHPHAEATYSVVPLADGTFSVEVVIPESYPTKVSPSRPKPTQKHGSPSTDAGSNPRNGRADGFAAPAARNNSRRSGSLLRPLWISQRNPVGDATAGGLE